MKMLFIKFWSTCSSMMCTHPFFIDKFLNLWYMIFHCFIKYCLTSCLCYSLGTWYNFALIYTTDNLEHWVAHSSLEVLICYYPKSCLKKPYPNPQMTWSADLGGGSFLSLNTFKFSFLEYNSLFLGSNTY